MPRPQQGYDTGGGEESEHQARAAAGIPAAPGEYMLPHTRLELRHTMGPPGNSHAVPYFGRILAPYGAQAMIHPHMRGVQQERMPLPSAMMEEEILFVNPKQYPRMVKRRVKRAKAAAKSNTVKTRKKYLHESRHLHALRRERGAGGQFVKTKAKKKPAAKAEARRRAAEGQSSNGNHNHNTDSQTTRHSEQAMMDSSQGLQGGGLSSQGVPPLQQMQHHAGLLSHGHMAMVHEAPVGGYHNHQQPQSFHQSAFHPLPGGAYASDGSQGGTMVSSTPQQAVVTSEEGFGLVDGCNHFDHSLNDITLPQFDS